MLKGTMMAIMLPAAECVQKKKKVASLWQMLA